MIGALPLAAFVLAVLGGALLGLLGKLPMFGGADGQAWRDTARCNRTSPLVVLPFARATSALRSRLMICAGLSLFGAAIVPSPFVS